MNYLSILKNKLLKLEAYKAILTEAKSRMFDYSPTIEILITANPDDAGLIIMAAFEV